MNPYTPGQLTSLVLVRLVIGWYLLHEGVIKIWSPGAGVLHWLDHDSLALRVISRLDLPSAWVLAINEVNTWGLVLVGTGLILGLFERGAALGGAAILFFHGVSHLPLTGPEVQMLANPVFLQTMVLVLLSVFRTSHLMGLDRLRRPLGARAPLTAIGISAR
jgi:thiosulfate dehydrogenase [quinone] large subunit